LTDETQVLLKVLAMADKEIEAGETVPIEDGHKGVWRGSQAVGTGKVEEGQR
jgi:hypothetical protein